MGLGNRHLKELSSEALVEAIRSGNPLAEHEMITRFSRGLNLMLQRKCNPDVVADVSQETWRVVIEKVRNGDLRQPDRLAAFIHQTARNQTVMYFRKYSDSVDDPEENELVSPTASPEEAYETSRVQQYVRDLINSLDTPRDREILTRFYVDEEDKDVICEELQLTSQHFNRVIYRAKSRMKAFIQKEQD
ncbi:RNA polymerase sigma factor [Sessilibacter corallicola]|uniref:Sigma-70 family RNA polymerase sigma factor n=1 Tax=Sessilibacter corallicola TaxID=2904075 RepID=A0ABQ0AE91_9GAMM|nr:sigma-70 family RNA polymerase sigma factor [Sessilibacter corallicola]MCE2028314.1 sigma-70 family RNA polymerase sigma factor [Sessilibacter corallicola]